MKGERGTPSGVGPWRARLSAAIGSLVLVGGVLGVGTAAATAGAMRTGTAGALPGSAARLIRGGPRGAVYRLSDGRRMLVSRDGTVQRAGSGFFSILTFGTITAHGRRFAITIQASRGAGADDLMIDIGDGIAKSPHRVAFQDHMYDFGNPGAGWLQLPRNLSHGAISTGGLMGRWGDIELTYAGVGKRTVRCGGKNVFQRASAAGHVTFTPQRDNGFFGTISAIHVRRSLIEVRRGCVGGGPGAGGGHHPPPCPTQPLIVDANEHAGNWFADFFGSTFRGGHKTWENVNYQQFIGSVAVWHEIFVQTSPAAVGMHTGRRATLTAMPDTYLTGSATLTAAGPPEKDGPHPCGKGRRATGYTFLGPMSGTAGAPFTAHFDTGAIGVLESPNGIDGFYEKVRISG